MLHAKFQNHRPSGSGKEDFNGFCYLQPWQPSWSCDLDHLYKLSFPLPKDAPHEVWLSLAVSEEMIFKIVDAGRMTPDARAWVYYKLTCEPKAQVS